MQDARNLNSGKVSVAYYKILRSILSISLKPGHLVDKERIARELGVSTQPITSAIYELERDGYVEIRPQKGSFVTHVRLRRMIEGSFVTTALLLASHNRLRPEDRTTLVPMLREALADMDASIAREDIVQAFSVSRDFRQLIVEATNHELAIHEAIRARNYQQWGMATAIKADRQGRVYTRKFQMENVSQMRDYCGQMLQAVEACDTPAYTQSVLKIHELSCWGYELISAKQPDVILRDDAPVSSDQSGFGDAA